MWFTNILFLLTVPLGVFAQKECTIALDQNLRNTKIFLDVFKWSMPKRSSPSKTNNVSSGEVMTFECGNGFVRSDIPGVANNFQCTRGKYNATWPYEELLCRSDYHKESLAVRISPTRILSKIFKCDNPDWELYQMKTMGSNGTSKLLYTVCLDAKHMRPKFVFQPSTSEKPPVGLALEERNDVWGFDGYGKSVHEMLAISRGYVEKTQRNRTTASFPQKYNSKKQYPYYFNRGHLAPYADFAEKTDRKATCEYINAAPQWEDFNKNSWSLVEREARSMRQKNPEQWEVYTGTYGSIPTTRGPLFVAPIFQNKKFVKGLLPVPMLYWKLVYNTADKTKSKAFIGVNNPEIRSANDVVNAYRICPPLPTATKNTIEGSEFFGFYYQCEVGEFIKALRNNEKVIKDAFVF